jgi:hypothetical protein
MLTRRPKTVVRAPINGKFRRVARRLFGGGNNTPARNAKSILTRKYRVLRKYPNIVNKYLIAPRSLSPMTTPRRYKPRSPPLPLPPKPRSTTSIGVGTSVSVRAPESLSVSLSKVRKANAFRKRKLLQALKRPVLNRVKRLSNRQKANAFRMKKLLQALKKPVLNRAEKQLKANAFRKKKLFEALKKTKLTQVEKLFKYLRQQRKMTTQQIYDYAQDLRRSKTFRYTVMGAALLFFLYNKYPQMFPTGMSGFTTGPSANEGGPGVNTDELQYNTYWT